MAGATLNYRAARRNGYFGRTLRMMIRYKGMFSTREQFKTLCNHLYDLELAQQNINVHEANLFFFNCLGQRPETSAFHSALDGSCFELLFSVVEKVTPKSLRTPQSRLWLLRLQAGFSFLTALLFHYMRLVKEVALVIVMTNPSNRTGIYGLLAGRLVGSLVIPEVLNLIAWCASHEFLKRSPWHIKLISAVFFPFIPAWIEFNIFRLELRSIRALGDMRHAIANDDRRLLTKSESDLTELDELLSDLRCITMKFYYHEAIYGHGMFVKTIFNHLKSSSFTFPYEEILSSGIEGTAIGTIWLAVATSVISMAWALRRLIVDVFLMASNNGLKVNFFLIFLLEDNRPGSHLRALDHLLP